MSQPLKIAMRGSKDGDVVMNSRTMDESERTMAATPVEDSVENHQGGMPRPLKKQQGSREFHGVPELKDYVSFSRLHPETFESLVF